MGASCCTEKYSVPLLTEYILVRKTAALVSINFLQVPSRSISVVTVSCAVARRRCVLTVLRTLLAALGLWLAAGACVRTGRAAAVQPAPAPGPLLPVGVPAPAPAPHISFNVSSFGNGDTVSVTWSVPSADDAQLGRTDMVALFLANASNPLHNEPIKYKWAAASEGHLASGTGSHTYAAWPHLPSVCCVISYCSFHAVLEATSSGSTTHAAGRFRLINQRQDVLALFIRNVTRVRRFATAGVVARSAPVRLREPNKPQHLHLAIAAAEGCALLLRALAVCGCMWMCCWGASPPASHRL